MYSISSFSITLLSHCPMSVPVRPPSEKVSLEKSAQAAHSKAQILQMDCEKLQLAVTSAQRERDHEREEKESSIQERERAKAETERV